MAERGIPASRAELQKTIAEELGVASSEIGCDVNLAEIGLDSVTAIKLVSRWQRDGLGVPFEEFSREPTLAGWWELLVRAPDGVRPR
ncbi:phosphopantetheine-binding protein [Goodfellowiella coeruleoviolacea]|uniref:phosphopantetheine-binding protein n=1 Tax=Goodfellowiella coeruleoviolacea TaxID=334858 RepID=UPI0038993759